VVGARARAGDLYVEGDPGPLRWCALSRAHRALDDLIRFVAGPDGALVADLARRLPGRGVWVEATREAIKTAVRQKVFARGLKRQLAVPQDLAERVEVLLAKRLCEAVSLANKAGVLVSGFAKVDGLLDGGRVAVLIHAADGATDGVARLDRKFKALLGAEAAQGATIVELSGTELSLAMGRLNVVHAAALAGGAGQRMLGEARRLRRYRAGQLAGSEGDRRAGQKAKQKADQKGDHEAGHRAEREADQDVSWDLVHNTGPDGVAGVRDGSTGRAKDRGRT
jgi:predicted RNA-binding protein YlxR (DUF448 family)